MPAPKGRPGGSCIWFISSIFFLFIAAGGVFLVLYVVLPESEETVWFPAVGMILVGIPWLFWVMTCFYRSMKLRQPGINERLPVRVASVAPAPGGATATINTAAAASASAAGDSPVDSPGSTRRVRSGAAIGSSQETAAGGDRGKGKAPMDGEVDGTNEESLTSCESERPLAFSMS